MLIRIKLPLTISSFMINMQQSSQILAEAENAARILLMCHANPDGDALGSLLGFAVILHERFPEKDVRTLCRDAVPSSLQFLPQAGSVTAAYTPTQGDLLFILDSAEPKLTHFEEEHPDLFDPTRAEAAGIMTVKIDHHPIGTPFARLNLVDPQSASTAELIMELADELGFPISPVAATCLLTGLYTDTGSMMHSNTTARVYRTAARLFACGADNQAIIRNIYRTSRLSTLRLWGRVLENISLTEQGGAISALRMSDFRATGADFSELTGAIDYVNSIPGMRFSLILSERDGIVKGSLRTLQDDVDVAAMAQKFQGGGHRKAAGFSLKGGLEKEVRWKVTQPTATAVQNEPSPEENV